MGDEREIGTTNKFTGCFALLKSLVQIQFDGQLYVSLAELREKVLINSSRCALKTQMFRLKIKATHAEGICRERLNNKLGVKKGGHFIIRLSDAEKLISSRRRGQTENVQETAIQKDEESSSCAPRDEETSIAASVLLNLSKSTQQQQISSNVNQRGQCDVERGLTLEEKGPQSNDNGLDSKLEKQFESLRRHYTQSLNAYRAGRPLNRGSTLKKVEQRLKTFMEYLRREKKQTSISLDQCCDAELASDFAQKLLEKDNLKVGTIAGYVQSIIYAAKFVKCRESCYEDEEIQRLRNLQSQLQRRAELERRVQNPQNASGKYFTWNQVLQVLRIMKSEVETYSGNPIAKARLFHDFVILLTLTSIGAMRNLDLMRLRIVHGDGENLPRSIAGEDQNYIIFTPENTLEMRIYNFKTKNKFGVNRINVSNVDYLERHIRLYVEDHRGKLLSGQEHDFLFLRKCGKAFETSSSFSSYLKSAFLEFSDGLEFNTTNLRKALVNWLFEGNVDEEIKASVARLMSHSSRVQRLRYHTMGDQQRLKAGVKHMADTTAASLGVNRRQKTALQVDSCPLEEQIVAIVAESSTRQNPEVSVAKVLSVDFTEGTAKVSKLDEEEPGRYKMRIGHWCQVDISTLISPIDIYFDRVENLYILRSTKEDINDFAQEHRRSDMI